MSFQERIRDLFHVTYLRFIVWQRKKDSKREINQIISASNVKSLSERQMSEIMSFWRQFSRKKHFDMKWYEVFNAFNTKEKQLKFYIPQDFYYCFVDTTFTNAQKAPVLDDKNLYDLYFHDVEKPKTVCRKMGNVYLDADYSIIELEDCVNKCLEKGNIIIKSSINSSGGHSIFFWNSKESTRQELVDLLNKLDNYIVQEIIVQHESISKLHKESVNTIRIMTLIWNNRVWLVSSVIRMGVNDAKVDNAHSGGVVCGIKGNGNLREIAYDGSFNAYKKHPQGTVFSDIVIPNFDKCQKIAIKLATRFSSISKLISWDFAIDSNANPLLIETNLTYGGIDVHQKCNGPLFGDETEAVLRYVFANHPLLKKR